MPSPEIRLLRLARPPAGRLAGVALLAACASGASVALLGVSAWLIMRASFHPPVLWLMVAVVGVRFFGISRGVFRYAERLLSHDVAFDALRSLRLTVYRRLERIAPIGPVWRRGDLLDRLIADVDALADLITRVILPIASTALVTGGAVLTAFLILPAAGAVLLVAALLAMVAGPSLVWRGDVRDAAALREVRARRSALVAESVLAASDPGLRALRGSWVARVAELDDQERRLASRAASRAGAAAGLSMLALAGGVLAILAVAAHAAATGVIAAENAAVVVMLPLGLIELGALIEPALATRLAVRASATRLIEVLDTPAPAERTGATVRSGAGAPGSPWPITLSGASIRWPGCDEAAVRGVDLRLEPGRPVALVGPSGSGKSTVLAALMGYAEVTGGQYRIGGRPASELAADDVLALFGWCDQAAHLFDTSVAENLRLARPGATDAELVAVLERAQLGPWLRSLPKGLDTRVGAFGVLVSGGQRQRLALARALLADRPVLLIDEPTAGLDREVADDLMRDILAESAGKALLVVTHDRSCLDRFAVVELGSPADARRLDVASA